MVTLSNMSLTKVKLYFSLILIMLGIVLTVVFWTHEPYKIYISKLWTILFIICIAAGGLLRCAKCATAKMSTKEAALRFTGIIVAMFFLFNGLGTSLAITTKEPNIHFTTLAVENMLPDILGALFLNSSAGLVAAFTFLGSILIIHGDATNNHDEYGIGAIAICLPVTALAILHALGYIAPMPIMLVFGALAPYMSSAAVVVVGFFFAKIGFMFDDMVKSAVSGE